MDVAQHTRVYSRIHAHDGFLRRLTAHVDLGLGERFYIFGHGALSALGYGDFFVFKQPQVVQLDSRFNDARLHEHAVLLGLFEDDSLFIYVED